jgi:hypothetical protein
MTPIAKRLREEIVLGLIDHRCRWCNAIMMPKPNITTRKTFLRLKYCDEKCRQKGNALRVSLREEPPPMSKGKNEPGAT